MKTIKNPVLVGMLSAAAVLSFGITYLLTQHPNKRTDTTTISTTLFTTDIRPIRATYNIPIQSANKSTFEQTNINAHWKANITAYCNTYKLTNSAAFNKQTLRTT